MMMMMVGTIVVKLGIAKPSPLNRPQTSLLALMYIYFDS